MEKENKFKYLVFPDQTYILEWDDGLKVEVTGEDILAQFRRESYLDKLIHQIDDNNKEGPADK